MPRQKDVRLQPFAYPLGGQNHEGDTIIVTEPGFDNFSVHNRMVHAVMQAIKGLQDMPERGEAPAADDAGDPGEALMMLMAFGMTDGKAYDEFCKTVMRELTDRPQLARVKGSDAPLKDLTWKNIWATNGMDGVTKILSTFIGFFVPGTASLAPNASGRDGLTSSSSPTAVASLAGMPNVVRYES